MKKPKRKILLLLLPSAIIFLCAGIFLTVDATKFQREGIKTQAEIVFIEQKDVNDENAEITVYVKYTVNNTEYTEKLNFYTSSFKVGSLVPIYYLQNNPSTISYARMQFFLPVLFFVSAVVCLGFCVYIFLSKQVLNEL